MQQHWIAAVKLDEALPEHHTDGHRHPVSCSGPQPLSEVVVPAEATKHWCHLFQGPVACVQVLVVGTVRCCEGTILHAQHLILKVAEEAWH